MLAKLASFALAAAISCVPACATTGTPSVDPLRVAQAAIEIAQCVDATLQKRALAPAPAPSIAPAPAPADAPLPPPEPVAAVQ